MNAAHLTTGDYISLLPWWLLGEVGYGVAGGCEEFLGHVEDYADGFCVASINARNVSALEDFEVGLACLRLELLADSRPVKSGLCQD